MSARPTTADLPARILAVLHDNPLTGTVRARVASDAGPMQVQGPAPRLQAGMTVELVDRQPDSQGVTQCALIRPAWPRDPDLAVAALAGGWLGRLSHATAERIGRRMGSLSMERLAHLSAEEIAQRHGLRDPGLPHACRIAVSVLNARRALHAMQRRGATPRQAVMALRRLGAEVALQRARTQPLKPPPAPAQQLEPALEAIRRSFRRADQDGHCGLTTDLLLQTLEPFGKRRAGAALDVFLDRGHGVADAGLVQTREIDRLETDLADRLVALAAGPAPVAPAARQASLRAAADAAGFPLSPDQAQALRALLAHPLGVLTGGPGTGKSAITRALVAGLEAAGRTLALAAPTGKAARRLSESTGRPACTLHSLLGDRPDGGADAPPPTIRADAVLVDEASMMDLALAQRLAAALPESATLILIGDQDQLPSVGAGQVLADLIDSEVAAVARLTRVHRQNADSGIVGVARAINAGEMTDLTPRRDAEVFFLPAPDPAAAARLAVDLAARRLPRAYDLDPLEDIQTLTALRERGPISSARLNADLQKALLPAGGTRMRLPRGQLHLGDRAIYTLNDPASGLVNGDTGRIEALDPGRRTARLRSADGRTIELAAQQLRALEPAHALTVHKSQGSEYPAVVLPLWPDQAPLLTRRLVYTAVTRARSRVVMLGDRTALQRAVESGSDPRRTGLAHKLRAARALQTARPIRSYAA